MSIIGLLVFVLILALVIYLVNMLPMEGNLKRIVQAVVLVIAIVYLLDVLFGLGLFATRIRLR